MKRIVAMTCVALACSGVAAEELLTLTDADRKFLERKFSTLTKAERVRYLKLADIRYAIEDGGEVAYPGTPSGKIVVANLQKRVPTGQIAKLSGAFQSLMEYDLHFTDRVVPAEIVVRIVDKPGERALTVWPDEGQAEVNVAALAADNPKPAFLAARTRKEVLRGFACATAGSTYGAPLFGKIKNIADLDNVGSEDFTLDVILRTNRYLTDAGVKAIVRGSYREVLEAGYNLAPTNRYQKAIWDELHKLPTNPITIQRESERK